MKELLVNRGFDLVYRIEKIYNQSVFALKIQKIKTPWIVTEQQIQLLVGWITDKYIIIY